MGGTTEGRAIMTGKTPVLYKRTSTGKIQTWRCEINPVGRTSYRTVSGKQGGKLVTSAWTHPTPKNVGRSNETSRAEQTELEVAAKYKKQFEEGYTEDALAVDTAAVFEPMLAKKFEDYADTITYPVFTQPKLDGIRCIASKDGLRTRNGKAITSCPHIVEALAFFFKWHPNTVLDGELYADKLKNNFNEICSLVKRTKPTASDLQRAAETVQYWIYDVAVMGGPSTACALFSERTAFINRELFSRPRTESNPLVRVETWRADTRRSLDTYYEDWLNEGMEGQMIRLDAPYENKRSATLLKRKEFQDAEYVVVDVLEGIGNRAGTAGKMRLTDADTETRKRVTLGPAVTFDSNIKGDFAYVTQLLKDRKKLIGKTVTVKFFNLTPAGIPRFPFVVAVRDYE
jgi:DNA ligase-1